ncbi:MAG: alpha-L-fucosidase [Candidatus Omnitrophota bacterium]
MKKTKWWQQDRFGMFIHWGVYAVPAGVWENKRIPGLGEWIMFNAKIPADEYTALTRKFNPVKFNADEWVKIAKNAGMKYMVITAKHHDGFAMFKSYCDPYNIVDATPYQHDVLADLANACKKAGIRLGFYYSQSQDWHEPHAAHTMSHRPEGDATGFAEYLERKVKPQLRELLTNYGEVALIWFDTPAFISPAQSKDLEKLVYSLQPKCLINSRIGNNIGDYASLGDNWVPFGDIEGNWETPATINDTWGYKKYDQNWKPVSALLRTLTRLAGRGMNYLLNVGPTAEGAIPAQSVDRLEQMGNWLKENDEAVYGTAGSPYPYEFDWGDITQKPGKLYLLVAEWPGQRLNLYGLHNRVRNVHLLKNPGQKLSFEQSRDPVSGYNLLSVTLPCNAPGKPISVVAVTIEGSAKVEQDILPQSNGTISLPIHLAGVHNQPEVPTFVDLHPIRIMPYGNTWWNSTRSWVEWTFKVVRPGRYSVNVITAVPACWREHWKDLAGSHVVVSCAGKRLSRLLVDNGRSKPSLDWYKKSLVTNMGMVDFKCAGEYHLELKVSKLSREWMLLHGVDLVRLENRL